MSNIKRLVVILNMLCITFLLSGCIFLLPDMGERLDALLVDSTVTEEEENVLTPDDELVQSELPADIIPVQIVYEVLPYFTDRELCYSGEVYHEVDNICVLPVTCETSL